MLYKREGIPEEGEIILCTVKKILYHSIFVDLDEYKNIEGMIHISEIAPGRIRNIRDYVREDKKIVCKVLRTNNRNIDLSLRRVPLTIKNKKNEDFKLEIKAENILKFVAEKLKMPLEELAKKIDSKTVLKYGSLHSLLQQISINELLLKELKLQKKEELLLLTAIKERIKPVEVKISGILSLQSTKPNGIEIIKQNIEKALALSQKNKWDAHFLYIGAPNYRIIVKAEDYKTAEKYMQELTSIIISETEKSNSTASFTREKND